MSKKQYQETLELLYFSVREIERNKRNEILTYNVLKALESVLDDLFQTSEKLTGQRKEKADDYLTKLVFVHSRLGTCLLNELSANEDLKRCQASLLELTNENEELKRQLKVAGMIDEM